MALFVLRTLVALCIVTSVSSCSCYKPSIFLQDIYCDAEYIIQFQITGSQEIGVVAGDPNSGTRRYIITNPVVYKSSSAYNAVADKTSLYTPVPGNLCGVVLNVGTTYIIAGYISGGQLRIGLCSALYKPVGQFTADQLSQLNSGYDDECNDCNIQYCENQSKCNRLRQSKNSCVGNQDGLAFSCRDKYAVCTRTRLGCRWVSVSGKLCSCLNPRRISPFPIRRIQRIQ